MRDGVVVGATDATFHGGSPSFTNTPCFWTMTVASILGQRVSLVVKKV